MTKETRMYREMLDDDDVDGCEADFKAEPCTDAEVQVLLIVRSQDRTEEEEETRRAL